MIQNAGLILHTKQDVNYFSLIVTEEANKTMHLVSCKEAMEKRIEKNPLIDRARHVISLK